MANKEYKQKIAQYIKGMVTSKKPPKGSSTGLLSPKDIKPAAMKEQKDSIAYVSEFIYTLRKQRQGIKAQRSKAE